MTRKHFALVATLLRDSYRAGEYRSTSAFQRAVMRQADAFINVNPNFDRIRFALACVEGTQGNEAWAADLRDKNKKRNAAALAGV